MKLLGRVSVCSITQFKILAEIWQFLDRNIRLPCLLFRVDFLQKSTPQCTHNLQNLYQLQPNIATLFHEAKNFPEYIAPISPLFFGNIPNITKTTNYTISPFRA